MIQKTRRKINRQCNTSSILPDGDYFEMNLSKGGGVLIAIKNTFTSSRCAYNANTANQLCVEIKNSSEKIIIGAAYFQPTDDVPVDEYLQHYLL